MQSIAPLAIVTGASSGMGYDLAKRCANNGCDLLAADAMNDLRLGMT